MDRPGPRALLTAVSCCVAPLALLLTLVPLAPADARADAADPSPAGVAMPLTAAPPEAPDPPDAPGTCPPVELRDDLLVLLADFTPPAPATTDPVEAALIDGPLAPAEPAEPAEPDLVDLVLPSKAMGGY